MVIQNYDVSCEHTKVNITFSNLLKMIMDMSSTARPSTMAANAALCTSEYTYRRNFNIRYVVNVNVVKAFFCSLHFHLCDSVVAVANTDEIAGTSIRVRSDMIPAPRWR